MEEARYRRLRQLARRLAQAIHDQPEEEVPSAEFQYLREQAKLVLASVEEDRAIVRGAADKTSASVDKLNAAEEILEWMTEHLRAEKYPGAQGFRLQMMRALGADIWERLMTEPPMGAYAEALANYLRDHQLLEDSVCELGAGAGALSRLITKDCRLTRTDIAPSFLDGRFSENEFIYDITKPFLGAERFSTVVAVNVFHCVKDRIAAIKNARGLLKPGGHLVFAEGNNFVRPQEPWALNMLFFPYDGWIQAGGFSDLESWQIALDQAGFKNVGGKLLRSGEFAVGGIAWGQT